ncbi:hypothetical protein BDF22DRAFT_744727 [Syncephalis plumigaleata]|nr:hypothetical protein BDF22DRAFT_744727 [Syncephalis plumigaleata]
MVLALGSVLWILGSLLYLSDPSRSDTVVGQNGQRAATTAGRIQSVGHASVGSAVPLDVLHRLYLEQKLPIDKNVPDKAEDMALTYRYKSQDYPPVVMRRITEQRRILVTGGAGFVGSHLVDRLMLMGHHVIVMDNLYTGSRHNIQHWIGHPNFEWLNHDVIDPLALEVDQIYHLACPASPPHYQKNPIKTIATSMYGTDNMLKLAQRNKARFLLTSTSEVYGDPQEHPQKETYWGNWQVLAEQVDNGPRSCYDEGKRVAESLTYAYATHDGVEVRVARIFNTFGPRMNAYDGRVVSNFIVQALRGEPLTIYGDGAQTRSFQYVHDLVDGLILLMNGNYTNPVNLGNPQEYTIKEFAEMIRDQVNDQVEIKALPPTEDDPQKRRPDIHLAAEQLGWQPRFTVQQGIEETVTYFRGLLPII